MYDQKPPWQNGAIVVPCLLLFFFFSLSISRNMLCAVYRRSAYTFRQAIQPMSVYDTHGAHSFASFAYIYNARNITMCKDFYYCGKMYVCAVLFSSFFLVILKPKEKQK